jgi:hypothetical protein
MKNPISLTAWLRMMLMHSVSADIYDNGPGLLTYVLDFSVASLWRRNGQ